MSAQSHTISGFSRLTLTILSLYDLLKYTQTHKDKGLVEGIRYRLIQILLGKTLYYLFLVIDIPSGLRTIYPRCLAIARAR